MDPLIGGLGRINGAATRITGAVATTMLAVMLAVGMAHVLFRYVLGGQLRMG